MHTTKSWTDECGFFNQEFILTYDCVFSTAGEPMGPGSWDRDRLTFLLDTDINNPEALLIKSLFFSYSKEIDGYLALMSMSYRYRSQSGELCYLHRDIRFNGVLSMHSNFWGLEPGSFDFTTPQITLRIENFKVIVTVTADSQEEIRLIEGEEEVEFDFFDENNKWKRREAERMKDESNEN